MLNDLQAKTRVIIEVERIEGKFKKLALEEADWLIGWAKETGQPDDVIDQLMAVRGRIVRLMIIEGLIPAPTLEERVKGRIAFQLDRDSPDQTNFPGYSSFWDTVNYNPAFQGRQMRPDSLKFPVFI